MVLVTAVKLVSLSSRLRICRSVPKTLDVISHPFNRKSDVRQARVIYRASSRRESEYVYAVTDIVSQFKASM
jgi:hypothetical protein